MSSSTSDQRVAQKWPGKRRRPEKQCISWNTDGPREGQALLVRRCDAASTGALGVSAECVSSASRAEGISRRELTRPPRGHQREHSIRRERTSYAVFRVKVRQIMAGLFKALDHLGSLENLREPLNSPAIIWLTLTRHRKFSPSGLSIPLLFLIYF